MSEQRTAWVKAKMMKAPICARHRWHLEKCEQDNLQSNWDGYECTVCGDRFTERCPLFVF